MTQVSPDPAEIARIKVHVHKYDTPKDDDPRRRYTEAQMEMAIRLALRAQPDSPADVPYDGDDFDLWSDEICDLVDAAFETVSRNPSDHETVVAYRRAILAALSNPAASDRAEKMREALEALGVARDALERVADILEHKGDRVQAEIARRDANAIRQFIADEAHRRIAHRRAIMDKPENPSAFPIVLTPGYEWAENGMTLRDWFAGQALTGLAWRYDENAHYDDVAGDAFKLADAMLAERSRHEG